MNKQKMDMLEKVFGAEINGSLFGSNSKIVKELEADGYIVLDEKVICKDRFGTVILKGYRTTLKGNAEYCMSDRCK
jgi:N-methylhydantoinase B/oxoprolinase/acetone carboxylase alpha subunit